MNLGKGSLTSFDRDIGILCEENNGVLAERRFDGKVYCPLGKVDCHYRTGDRVKDFVDETARRIKFYGCRNVYKPTLPSRLRD